MGRQKQFNTIIIGAGSTGSILAARLSEEAERTVLLIDAGPDYPDLASTPLEVKQGYGVPNRTPPFEFHDWGYRGQARSASDAIHIPRGKITGGSSAVNGMVFCGASRMISSGGPLPATNSGLLKRFCPTLKNLNGILTLTMSFMAQTAQLRCAAASRPSGGSIRRPITMAAGLWASPTVPTTTVLTPPVLAQCR